MNEKNPYPQHNSGEQPSDSQGDAVWFAEAPDHREQQLIWAVGDALLQAVYAAAENPGDETHAKVADTALEVVWATHIVNPASATDQQVLTAQANYICDRIVELAHTCDDLTTSDLQGVIDALALRLVRNRLPLDATERAKGGDHE
ncbi:hypothetical protein H0264_35765 [Nocardia huaxiensis]|uniref:Uncharacterized protein n=1 Tax=Nocardia huaxiensis TaxID=2755382 RepID=A0A7D6VBM7_9NOCA|nr:hypothetical protein [Nocardia huaxiensis]QLY30422.1 hypothetical protein H0264_35765 [Nocardia huaxiensis]